MPEGRDELEALRREVAELQQRLLVMEQSHRPAAPAPTATPPLRTPPEEMAATAPRSRLRRRDLLRAVPLAAAAAGTLGVVELLAAQPAAAADGTAILQGRTNAGTETTQITTATSTGTGPTALSVSGGLEADSVSVIADVDVTGSTSLHNAFGGESLTVSGATLGYDARVAASITGAVAGHFQERYGAPALLLSGVTGPVLSIALSDGATSGPLGTTVPTPGTGLAITGNNMATGVDIGVGNGGTALTARQTSAAATSNVVSVVNDGTGRTIYAECVSTKSYNAVITGTADGPGIGVWGQHNGATGYGVVGASTNGVGGRFQGGIANLRLIPSTASTHPSTGVAGDVFVDRSVRLWFCVTPSASGVAAVWKQLA